MAPPSVSQTAKATNTSTGERPIAAVTATVASSKRLTNPQKPRADLCGLNFRDTGGGVLSGPLADKAPNSGLEVFTRKFLHLTANLFDRPRHRFKSTDRIGDVIHVPFRETNPVDPILNLFRRPARAPSTNPTTTRPPLDSR